MNISGRKKVLIDLCALKYPFSGFEYVNHNFALAISQLDAPDIEFTFLVPGSSYWNYGKNVKYRNIDILLSNNIALLNYDYDLWHSTYQTARHNPPKKIKSILTIHDLNFLGEKHQKKHPKYLNRIQNKIKRSSHLTYISKFTQVEVNKHLNIDKTIKSDVIYNGVNFENNETRRPEGLKNDAPFLFNIGLMRPKKNIHTLIPFLKKLQGYNLVFAGADHTSAYANEIRTLINENNLGHKVTILGPVSETEKNYLFEHCEAFLFPTLNEGFGIPIIEAMNHGKPIFCSNKSSLPEIGSNHAFYWQNFDPDHMLDIFNDGLSSFSADVVKKSATQKEHAQSFTWKKNALSYLKLYRELLNLPG